MLIETTKNGLEDFGLSNDQLAYIASDPKLYAKQREELAKSLEENAKLVKKRVTQERLDKALAEAEQKRDAAKASLKEANAILDKAKADCERMTAKNTADCEDVMQTVVDLRNQTAQLKKKAEDNANKTAEANAKAEERLSSIKDKEDYLDGRKSKIKTLIEQAQGLL